MASVTYYVVQPFEITGKGMVRAGQPQECQSRGQAISTTRRLALLGGAIAFSRTGDPATGHFDDAVEIDRAGEIPEDFVELAAAAA